VRGCLLPKRAASTTLWSLTGFVEAVNQVVLAGRCTTPPNLPSCRGWGEWNRCDVVTWVLLKPMAISAAWKRLLLPWYLATCGWLMSPIVRLARGQAVSECIAYHHITRFAIHRIRLGSSAKVHREVRQHAILYGDLAAKIIHVTLRG
jgi:hypothetical protein